MSPILMRLTEQMPESETLNKVLDMLLSYSNQAAVRRRGSNFHSAQHCHELSIFAPSPNDVIGCTSDGLDAKNRWFSSSVVLEKCLVWGTAESDP